MSNEYQSIYHYCMASFTIIRSFNAAMSAHLQMVINLITILSSPRHFIAETYQMNTFLLIHSLPTLRNALYDEISQTSLQEIFFYHSHHINIRFEASESAEYVTDIMTFIKISYLVTSDFITISLFLLLAGYWLSSPLLVCKIIQFFNLYWI